MEDRFRIAVRLVDVALRFERLAIVCVVVDLAVIRYVQRRVFVRHRLMTGRDIHNAQTTMAQADIAVDKYALFIGTAMRNDVTHCLQNSTGDFPPRSARKRYSVNATHM